jgi:hypothetical protein
VAAAQAQVRIALQFAFDQQRGLGPWDWDFRLFVVLQVQHDDAPGALDELARALVGYISAGLARPDRGLARKAHFDQLVRAQLLRNLSDAGFGDTQLADLNDGFEEMCLGAQERALFTSEHESFGIGA